VLHRPVEPARIIGKFDGSGVSGSTGRGRSQALESKVRFADIHVVICQVKARVSRARSGERANQQFQDVLRATVCLSASVPALGRTRHPFAVSGLEGPSPKIEFVFSASPETIRREPRECDLLRSVGNMQDLAVCAFLFILFISTAFMHEVSLLPIHGKQIGDHLPGYGKCRPIPVSFLLFPVVDHG
jgi:hypothetical protein